MEKLNVKGFLGIIIPSITDLGQRSYRSIFTPYWPSHKHILAYFRKL